MEVGLEMGMGMEKMQKPEHVTAPTIGEVWLQDFFSKIDAEHFNRKFGRPLLCLMDEYRKDGDRAVYNTSRKIVSRRSLAHLNMEAKLGDEYDSVAMEKLVSAYQEYELFVRILAQKVQNRDRKEILDSALLFSFLMRDSLTREDKRIIRDDPVTAALKLALFPYQLVSRLGGKDSAERCIHYIWTRMAAKVTSAVAQWCHEIFPVEAEKCGLSKEPVGGEWVDRVGLAYGLENLDLEAIDLDYIYNVAELQNIVTFAEDLIDDGHVFYFSDEEIEDGYYVLRETDDGKYFQQHIRDCGFFYGGYGLVLLEDEDMITAILDLGISPIFLSEEDEKSGLVS